MREKRRLKLAKRQLMVARVSRRSAISDLAGALADQEKSAQLASRSRHLAGEYGASRGDSDGASLTERGSFSGALGRLAHEAEQARDDAGQQVDWQMDALAAAEHRTKRMSEFAQQVQQQIDAAKARVAEVSDAKVARKLHGQSAKQHSTKPSRKSR